MILHIFLLLRSHDSKWEDHVRYHGTLQFTTYTCMYVYTCVTDTYLFILKYTPALCFYLELYDLYIRYNVAC